MHGPGPVGAWSEPSVHCATLAVTPARKSREKLSRVAERAMLVVSEFCGVIRFIVVLYIVFSQSVSDTQESQDSVLGAGTVSQSVQSPCGLSQ